MSFGLVHLILNHDVAIIRLDGGCKEGAAMQGAIYEEVDTNL